VIDGKEERKVKASTFLLSLFFCMGLIGRSKNEVIEQRVLQMGSLVFNARVDHRKWTASNFRI